MKKVYEKPMVRLDYFTLSQSVAVDCGYSDDKYTGFPTHRDKNSCGWNNGITGEVYWTSTPACSDAYLELEDVGEVCYNNPDGGKAVFSSL